MTARTVSTPVFFVLLYGIVFGIFAVAWAAEREWGVAGWAAVVFGSITGLVIVRFWGGGMAEAVAGALKRPEATKSGGSAHGGRRQ